MVRLVRGVCLVCFSLLAAAVAIAIVEFAAPAMTTNITGCQWNGEILPNFSCPQGVLQRPAELILNLPILFVLAPTLTIVGVRPPNPKFTTLLYVFDVILLLGLTHPLLALLARRRTRRELNAKTP